MCSGRDTHDIEAYEKELMDENANRFPPLKQIEELLSAWAREHAQMQVSFDRELGRSIEQC